MHQVLGKGQKGKELLTARELKSSEIVIVHPDDDLEAALHLLEHKNFSALPVVLPPRDKVLVGILKMEDVLTAYNQRLLRDQAFRSSTLD